MLTCYQVWNFDSKSFEGDKAFPSSRPFSRIRHNCQTVSVHFLLVLLEAKHFLQGKWVTLLKAQWTQNPDVYPYFTVSVVVNCRSFVLVSLRFKQIGNMNHSLDIYSAKGDHIASLSDPRRYVFPSLSPRNLFTYDLLQNYCSAGRHLFTPKHRRASGEC